MTDANLTPSASRPSAVACLALAVVVAAAGGCKHDEVAGPQVAGWALVDPAQRHPIIVSQQPQTLELRVPASARGLSPRQRAEMLEFADRSRANDAGNSRMVIQAPGGGPNEIASMHAVGEIRQILSDMGFAESSIGIEAYHAGSPSAPVRVSYLRYIAEAPVCGYWPTNLANQRDNANYPNFGCANQRNLAVMVANPADLIGPRTESDRSSERRDVVTGKYIKGEHSGAERPSDARDRTDVKSESAD